MATTRLLLAALGTRGDVQPVALLAWQLARHLYEHEQHQTPTPRDQRTNVVFVTHAVHQAWLHQLQLAFTDDSTGRQLQFVYISSLPAAVWHQQQEPQRPENSSNDSSINGQVRCSGKGSSSSSTSSDLLSQAGLFSHNNGSAGEDAGA